MGEPEPGCGMDQGLAAARRGQAKGARGWESLGSGLPDAGSLGWESLGPERPGSE